VLKVRAVRAVLLIWTIVTVVTNVIGIIDDSNHVLNEVAPVTVVVTDPGHTVNMPHVVHVVDVVEAELPHQQLDLSLILLLNMPNEIAAQVAPVTDPGHTMNMPHVVRVVDVVEAELPHQQLDLLLRQLLIQTSLWKKSCAYRTKSRRRNPCFVLLAAVVALVAIRAVLPGTLRCRPAPVSSCRITVPG